MSPAKQRAERLLVPFLGRRLRHHLLREHVERLFGNENAVELAVLRRADHRRALDQVVPGEREDPSLGKAGHRVAGAPHALQQRRDAVRRGDLADEIDVADVDPELEGGGRDQHPQPALAQLRLRVQAHLLGEAAVVGGDVRGAEPLRELVRHALGKPPRVDENQRGPVRLDQPDQASVGLLPHFGRHHRFERRPGHLDAKIDVAPVAVIHDGASGIPRTDEEARDFLDRLLRRRKPDALQAPAAHVIEPLERQREMRAAARFDHRVDLVDDDRARASQHLARALRGEEEIQRLGRRYQDVRGRAQHRRALGLRRIAASHRGGDVHGRVSRFFGNAPHLAARRGEVLVNVRRQRLERRDVYDAHLVGQPARPGEIAALEALAQQGVDRNEKRGERLPRAGRRGDQRVPALADRAPALELGVGRRQHPPAGGIAEARLPPAPQYGMEVFGKHDGPANIPQVGPSQADGCAAAAPYRARGCSMRSSGLLTPRPPLFSTCV